MSGSCYWRDHGDPVVHIYAACWNEGWPDARVGFGTNWGPDDPKNEEGSDVGENKSQLTAELIAVKRVLEMADLYRMRTLMIRHKSKKLSEELQIWEETPDREEFRRQNRDILKAIEVMRVNIQVWIEEVEPDEEAGLQIARFAARRAAGMHSTSKNPLNNAFWSYGVRIVHIFGTATRETKPRAGYGVFWGPRDERNESGGVEGEQSHRRGQIMAVYVAMSTAIDHHIDELIIQSKCEEMQYLIRPPRMISRVYRDLDRSHHQDLICRVEKLKPEFRILHHDLIPSNREIAGQQEASTLARHLRGIIRKEVSVSAVKTKCGVVRYGVYFGADDARNESGRIHGPQFQVIGELTAIKRAIEIAKKSRIRFLTIHTSTSRMEYFMDIEIHQWIRREWMIEEDKISVFADIGKQVAGLMDSVKLKTVFTPDSEATMTAAYSLANSPQLSKHLAVYTAGSCYYGPFGENDNEAGYGVFWNKGDPKNDHGCVSGIQNTICARLTAVIKALEIAHENAIPRVVVRVDCQSTYEMVAENMWNNMKNWKKHQNFKYRDLLEEIDGEAMKLENVEYEFCPSPDAKFLSQWVIHSNTDNSLEMPVYDL